MSGEPLNVLQTLAHAISCKPQTGQGVVNPLRIGVKAEARGSQILRQERLDSTEVAHIPGSSCRACDEEEAISGYVKVPTGQGTSDQEYN